MNALHQHHTIDGRSGTTRFLIVFGLAAILIPPAVSFRPASSRRPTFCPSAAAECCQRTNSVSSLPQQIPPQSIISSRFQSTTSTSTTKLSMLPPPGDGPIVILLAENDDDGEEDDDEEEDEEDEDTYKKFAESEFIDSPKDEKKTNKGSLVQAFLGSNLAAAPNTPTTSLDWGGALGKLRQRLDDMESGKSQDTSHVLFRLMSSQSPNQVIGNFIQSADPQVVQAMSGAVSSLLGGLSSPMSGVELIVKASADKIGSLCFQLQMTGYMFRNAEYVMALKQLMKLRKTATLNDYKAAFQELDTDGSGYIEASEIEQLLDRAVYGGGETPGFEVKAFLNFFDIDKDGKISWDEFEKGLGTAFANQNTQKKRLDYFLNGGEETKSSRSFDDDDDDDDDEDNDIPEIEPELSGTIEVELEDGKVVQVEAKEYVKSLREEAEALKKALKREALGIQDDDDDKLAGAANNKKNRQLPSMLRNEQSQMDEFGGIANYIASRRGDLKALTEGISPEIVETMKSLVDFVLEDSAKPALRGKSSMKDVQKEEIEMELPGSALQQLALWQLVLGYKLREFEATEEYLKLLSE